jgi:adenylate cyclase
MNEGVQRQRLAAILMADAVGYSRSMEIDEHGTLAALEAARSVFRSAVDANRGRVIDTSGDSVLAVFDSAAGAVIAALAVQGALDGAADPSTLGRRLRFRIGVHLGDVIETANQSVYGDGVNIAARLQALAEPGGVVISEAVRGAVKNRVPATFVDRGLQEVKNIGDPVRAYAVTAAGSAAAPAVDARSPPPSRPSRRLAATGAAVAFVVVGGLAAWWWPREPRAITPPAIAPAASAPAVSGKTSIAVLPFDNMSGDPEQSYFADGITEDLITDLSKVSGLFVIARNSTFVYKNKAHDVREIAQRLGVQYVLEGSVRKSGAEVRVNAQLIDASTGGHVWADRYDGDLKNIFGLQDTVTRSVVKALAVTLTKDESDRVARRGTRSVEAYDLFLKGWDRYLRQTPADFRAAIVEFTKATQLDPDYGRAYAALAAIDWQTFTRFWGEAVGLGPRNEDALYGAEQFLAKAMRSPTALAHQVASAMQLQAQQHDEAITAAKRSIESDPNDADGFIALAGAQSFSGRPAEALAAVDVAMRLNPHYPSSYLYQRGLAQFAANRVDEAAKSLEQAIAMNADDYWSQRLLLATYGVLGRGDDAHRLLATMRSKDRRGQSSFIDPLTIRAMTYWYPFTLAGDAQRFADGLAKAGVPD